MALLGKMTLKKARIREKVGFPPGTLVHIGERKVEKVRITLIDYDQKNFEEKEAEKIREQPYE